MIPRLIVVVPIEGRPRVYLVADSDEDEQALRARLSDELATLDEALDELRRAA